MKHFLMICLYFLILLALEAALGFSRGFGFDSALTVPFLARPDQIVQVFGPSDFASYVLMARLIPINGIETFRSGYGMFPPGLPIIQWLIFKLWHDAPIYAVLFPIGIALWSVFMVLFATILRRLFGLTQCVVFIAPLFLLAFPFFTNDCLWYSTGLSEGIALPLFWIACLCTLMLVIWPGKRIWLKAIVVGLLFASASFVRAQFDFAFAAIVLATAICVSLRWIYLRRHYALTPHFKRMAVALLVVFSTYQVTTIPYKIFKNAPTIVVMDNVWGAIWYSKEDAAKLGVPAVFIEAGMESVCQIDPVKCQEFTDRRNRGQDIDFHEYRRAAIAAILHQPMSLLKIKIPIFWHFWLVDMFESPSTPGSYGWMSEFVLVLSIPLSGAYALWRRAPVGLAYALYSVGFVVSCTIFSIIVHIEPRYFLPIKLLAALSLIVAVADLAHQRLAATRPTK